MLKKVIAKGGHKVHLKEEGAPASLCGHEPANTSFRMRARGGWWALKEEYQATQPVTCERCLKLAPADGQGGGNG